MTEDGQPVATFYRPLAFDADGRPVPATMTADASSLELDVPHSDPGIAYPIAVATSAGLFVAAASANATSVTPGMDGVGLGIHRGWL